MFCIKIACAYVSDMRDSELVSCFSALGLGYGMVAFEANKGEMCCGALRLLVAVATVTSHPLGEMELP